MSEVKFRMWTGTKMLYDIEVVYNCLMQQAAFNAKIEYPIPYNHVDDGAVFLQYAGLRDRNGKEIYEGDVVTAWDEEFIEMGRNKISGTIEYYENAFMLKSDKNVYTQYWPNAEQFEIIGNIYEQPELLK